MSLWPQDEMMDAYQRTQFGALARCHQVKDDFVNKYGTALSRGDVFIASVADNVTLKLGKHAVEEPEAPVCPTMFDIATGEMRPVSQDDVDQLVIVAQRYGRLLSLLEMFKDGAKFVADGSPN